MKITIDKALGDLSLVIKAYLADPPHSDFERGYLAALLQVYKEILDGSPDPRVELTTQTDLV